MATPQGQRLIESHRRAQLVLGARTVRAARSVWPLLDPADIDRTIEAASEVAEELTAR